MTKFCPECGFKQHNDNNKYCSNCGFDFSKVEKRDLNSAEDSNSSSINVPIEDLEHSDTTKPFDSESVDSPSKPTIQKPKTTVIKSSSNSNNQQTNTNNNYNQSNGFLSNLSFNKCFLAFAILLIILLIIGMLSQTTEKEPYSDDGLTSFMESSVDHDSSSLMDYLESDEDSSSDSNDYLSYNN